jgi:TRAP-type C4-dicarboxylate transport system permease small subunit
MNSSMHWLSTAFDGAVAFIPSLLAGLVILAVGYVAARILASATRALLARIRYDRFLAKIGLIDSADSRAGSQWTGTAVFAIVMLVAVMQAARAWNLQMVAEGISQIIAYVPNVIGAAAIFAAALYFGDWVRGRIARSEGAPVGQRPLVAAAVRAAVLAMGVFMALRELQIAPEIVTIAFTVTLGAIALAAALAFGLGSRNVAGQVTQQWYERQASNGHGAPKDAPSAVSTTWPGPGPRP